MLRKVRFSPDVVPSCCGLIGMTPEKPESVKNNSDQNPCAADGKPGQQAAIFKG
jgi:hypothetical protein